MYTIIRTWSYLSHTYYVHVYKNGCLSIATDEQFLLHRLANAAIDIYGMAAVISRYIKSMKLLCIIDVVKKEKICVGRESNPDLLLGRQQC